MLIRELLLSYYKTQCLYAVSELNIAEILNNGPKSAAELALLSNVNERKLYRILRFLTSVGLFDEAEDGYFSLNDESKCLLVEGATALKSFIKLHATCFYQSAEKIHASLQVDESPFELFYDMNAPKYFAEHADIRALYNTAMAENSKYYSQLLLQKYDFDSCKCIADIGGGVGTLMFAILEKYLHAKEIVFDLPALKETVEKAIALRHLQDRCQYMGGSYFEVMPLDADLYILKAILHGKNNQMAKQILLNIKDVMHQAAKILIIDRVVDRDKDFQAACVNDINMLNVTRGYDRTLGEFKALFADCGMRLNKLIYLEEAHFCLEVCL